MLPGNKWKLHEYFVDGRVELYDLESDIGERNNMAASHPEKGAELYRLLTQWRKEMDAPVPSRLNREYDPSGKAGTKKKIK